MQENSSNCSANERAYPSVAEVLMTSAVWPSYNHAFQRSLEDKHIGETRVLPMSSGFRIYTGWSKQILADLLPSRFTPLGLILKLSQDIPIVVKSYAT